jgi:two-component system response regulator AtoC
MANILYVDDEFYNQRIAGFILKGKGYQVVFARDGQEALEKLRQSPIDLVITDIHMPRMDGLTLLEELRTSGAYHNLPVIIVTASGREKIAKKALREGANGILTQPYGSWELQILVTQVLKAGVVSGHTQSSLNPL